MPCPQSTQPALRISDNLPMLRVYRAKNLSRAQLLGGPVRLSAQGQGQGLSEHHRDHGRVRLSDLRERPTDGARSDDTFEKTEQSRAR